MTRDEEIVNASNELFNSVRCGKSYKLGFNVGIKWADEHHRWRSVEEELPKQDEEVIVLCDDLNVAPNYRISFGHIVDVNNIVKTLVRYTPKVVVEWLVILVMVELVVKTLVHITAKMVVIFP